MISVRHQSTARVIRKYTSAFVWLSQDCDVIHWSFCAAPLQVEHTYWVKGACSFNRYNQWCCFFTACTQMLLVCTIVSLYWYPIGRKAVLCLKNGIFHECKKTKTNLLWNKVVMICLIKRLIHEKSIKYSPLENIYTSVLICQVSSSGDCLELTEKWNTKHRKNSNPIQPPLH